MHTSDRISTIAEYLNRNGYTKKLRQNNMLPTFSADFVKAVLDNPIYCGKIAYGRRKTVKRVGTRNETHIVWADDYPIHDGLHEAIVSEEVWQLAQKKRKNTCFAKESSRIPITRTSCPAFCGAPAAARDSMATSRAARPRTTRSGTIITARTP